MNPVIRAASVVVLALLLVSEIVTAPTATAQGTSAEEQLAQRFAPIVSLKEQGFDCDTAGEPYLPLPVDIVLNSPDVALKQIAASGGRAADQVVKMGPTAQDLAGKDETYYLDFPGKSRQPGCDYET